MTFGGSGITKELYDYIRRTLPEKSHILELGSGPVSTQHLSCYYQMTSVEDRIEYINKFNSRYIFAPLKDGWYDPEVLQMELPSVYDLLLVDGPTGEWNRAGLIKNLSLFRRDVPVIIDDTWREGEHRLAEALQSALGGSLEWFEHFAVLNPPDYSGQCSPSAEAQNLRQ